MRFLPKILLGSKHANDKFLSPFLKGEIFAYFFLLPRESKHLLKALRACSVNATLLLAFKSWKDFFSPNKKPMLSVSHPVDVCRLVSRAPAVQAAPPTTSSAPASPSPSFLSGGAVHTLPTPPPSLYKYTTPPPLPHSPPFHSPIPLASRGACLPGGAPPPWVTLRTRSTSSSPSSASRRATRDPSPAGPGAARAPSSPPPARPTTRCAPARPDPLAYLGDLAFVCVFGGF